MRRESLRKKILEEATAIVYNEGVDRITMRAPGEKLGYSPATIYLYFRNKDDLLFEIARHGFEGLAERQLPAFEREDAAVGLREMARSYLDFALENPALYQLMFQTLPPAREQLHAQPHVLALLEARDRFYERGIRQGVFSAERKEFQGGYFLSVVHGFAMLAIADRMPPVGSDKTISEMRDAVVEELVRSVISS